MERDDGQSSYARRFWLAKDQSAAVVGTNRQEAAVATGGSSREHEGRKHKTFMPGMDFHPSQFPFGPHGDKIDAADAHEYSLFGNHHFNVAVADEKAAVADGQVAVAVALRPSPPPLPWVETTAHDANARHRAKSKQSPIFT